jgi:hypothetical protein
LSKLLATIVCDVTDKDEKFSNLGLQSLARGQPDLQALEIFLAQYNFPARDSERILSLAHQLG